MKVPASLVIFEENNPHTAAYLTKESPEHPPFWHMDSACGGHATDQQALLNAECPGNGFFVIANGELAPIEAMGGIKIPLPDGGRLALNNTKFTSKLNANLISWGTLQQEGWSFKQISYEDEHSVFFTSPDCTTSFEAILTDNNVYIVKPTAKTADLITCTLTLPSYTNVPLYMVYKEADPLLAPNKLTTPTWIQEHSMEEWHTLWGHMNPEYIKILARDHHSGMKISGPKTLPFCHICTNAKQTHAAFAPAK